MHIFNCSLLKSYYNRFLCSNKHLFTQTTLSKGLFETQSEKSTVKKIINILAHVR